MFMQFFQRMANNQDYRSIQADQTQARVMVYDWNIKTNVTRFRTTTKQIIAIGSGATWSSHMYNNAVPISEFIRMKTSETLQGPRFDILTDTYRRFEIVCKNVVFS